MLPFANLALRRPRNIDVPTLGRDALAGVISAVVQIAYCISFAALIFQGALAAGFSLGLAAMIMGTAVTGVVIALTSTLSPANGGPDCRPWPSSAFSLERSPRRSRRAVAANKPSSPMSSSRFRVSTFFTGLLLYGIAALKLGQRRRFAPYPVIGGFLAASGLLSHHRRHGGRHPDGPFAGAFELAGAVLAAYGPQILAESSFAL